MNKLLFHEVLKFLYPFIHKASITCVVRCNVDGLFKGGWYSYHPIYHILAKFSLLILDFFRTFSLFTSLFFRLSGDMWVSKISLYLVHPGFSVSLWMFVKMLSNLSLTVMNPDYFQCCLSYESWCLSFSQSFVLGFWC